MNFASVRSELRAIARNCGAPRNSFATTEPRRAVCLGCGTIWKMGDTPKTLSRIIARLGILGPRQLDWLVDVVEQFARRPCCGPRVRPRDRWCACYLSLIDVHDCFLADEFLRSLSSHSIPRSDILLPEAVIGRPPVDVDAMVIPLLTRIWNAGDERCPHFYQHGKWMGP
jgi:hypothetical protein